MSFPTFIDEVAFASDPFDDPQVWTAVTPYTRTRGFRAGRRSERDRTEPGQSSLVLENIERRFDPENTASPYWPNVLPMRRLRSRATLGVSTYDVFEHFVDPQLGWSQAWDRPGYAEAQVQGNDAFNVLANNKLTAAESFPQQLSGARIDAILNAVGWPAGDRDTDAGQTVVSAAALGSVDGQDALSLILHAADTERGFFFIDGSGRAVFHDRHRRLLSPHTTVQATFTDAENESVGTLLFASLLTANSEIVNDWRLTRVGGNEAAAEDTGSIDRYGRRTKTLSTLHTSESEALDMALFLLSRSKDPHLRFEELVIEPGTDDDLWEQVLTRQIGDRVAVVFTPAGTGAPIEKECHIEAISLDVGPAVRAVCKWRLSPADVNTYWVLGTAGFSELGQTTVLAF